ncbi:hypothetical protein N7493_001946 [Penicillium malachiteum]|uniref:Uncharacterized protein n=1 Tax=Penicillium malachiteum TaxID=1324776 RepID=A0AAD6HVC3_9EURO|nr:hypothetical protein N7493_001946 [Penicillium malachiteum]
MVWFPLKVDSEEVTWSFDIVGLLAVVGGSAIEKHAQAITASPFGSFPRLLPAPETMLDTDRPPRLPAVKDVTVVGVHSGNQFNELNFFADVIHDVNGLVPYQFQSYHITHQKKDPEKNGTPADKANIPLHTFCPLNIVTFASILMTIALFVWAGVEHDAVGLLGLGTMSLSTSFACMSAQWRPKLSVRNVKGDVPPGDVVIRTRSGAFIAVKCEEEIARELYAGTEVCDYVFRGRFHQSLLGASTVLLMAAIIFFSNSSWKIQIAVGLGYIILNLAYWAMALLTEPKQTWNMEARYNVELLEDHVRANFTQVLWDSIRTTGKIGWIKKTHAAPATKNWDGWLQEAKENWNNHEWKAEEARDRWMKMRFDTDVPKTEVE